MEQERGSTANLILNVNKFEPYNENFSDTDEVLNIEPNSNNTKRMESKIENNNMQFVNDEISIFSHG